LQDLLTDADAAMTAPTVLPPSDRPT